MYTDPCDRHKRVDASVGSTSRRVHHSTVNALEERSDYVGVHESCVKMPVKDQDHAVFSTAQ